MPRGRILIYVEDPGAANFIAPVIGELQHAGWQIALAAAAAAADFFRDRQISATPAPENRDAAAYIENTNATVLMIGTSENPDTFGFALVDAAREAGVRSIGFVDGPANPGLRFRGRDTDPVAHAPDRLLVCDDRTAEAFAGLSYPREQIVVTGHPYYDSVRDEAARLRTQPTDAHRRRMLPNAPSDRPVVVFLGEGSDGLGMDIKRRSPEYTLTGRGTSDRRTEIVLEEFLDAVDALPCEPYLVFRAHPKDPASGYSDYLSRFDTVSEGGRHLELLFAADLVVGLSTSLLVEAALAGLNTMAILPARSQMYLVPTVLQGLTPCATDREALHALLRQRLDSDGERTPVPPIENASARVVEAINNIAGRP